MDNMGWHGPALKALEAALIQLTFYLFEKQ